MPTPELQLPDPWKAALNVGQCRLYKGKSNQCRREWKQLNMNSAFDPLTLVLLAAAAIIFWRLRSVLGTRTGLERPPVEFKRPSAITEAEIPELLPQTIEGEATEVSSGVPIWQGHAEKDSPLAKALIDLAKMAPNFSPDTFLAGAAAASEMILEAYAAGNKKALQPLLSKEVYEAFSSAIDERQRLGQSMTFRYVGMKKNHIESVGLLGDRASITTAFTCKAIGATTDSSGTVIDGDAKAIRDISNTWTFERDVTSRDPNWKLVST